MLYIIIPTPPPPLYSILKFAYVFMQLDLLPDTLQFRLSSNESRLVLKSVCNWLNKSHFVSFESSFLLVNNNCISANLFVNSKIAN